MTSNTTPPTDPPIPAAAIKAWDWEPPQRTGMPDATRYFIGTARSVESGERGHRDNAEVQIEGVQHSDGRVERAIRVSRVGDELTITQARQLAAALLAAADEADEMNGLDRSTVS